MSHNKLIEVLKKDLKEGNLIVSKSQIEPGFYIKLNHVYDNGYFIFNYSTKEGKPVELLNRTSINTVENYMWVKMNSETFNENYTEKKDFIDFSLVKDKDIFNQIIESFGMNEIEPEKIDITDKKIYDSVNKFISENGKGNLLEYLNSYAKEKSTYIKSVGIDFDGTMVTNIYPDLGTLKIGVRETIQALINSGTQVVIWTCRNEEDIVDFLHENNIKYHAINENTPEMIAQWGNNPRKAGVDLFIDDKNIFCKEILWKDIYTELERTGFIK